MWEISCIAFLAFFVSNLGFIGKATNRQRNNSDNRPQVRSKKQSDVNISRVRMDCYIAQK
jgi:hypothetical protein